VLDAAVSAAHHEKRVVPIRDVADQLGSRCNHLLQVFQHLRPVHRGRHVFHRDIVRHPLDIEPQILLIADQDGAIVEYVEIRRGESIDLASHWLEAGGDLLPDRRQLNGDRHGMLRHPRHVDKDARRRKVGPVIAQIRIGREGSRSVDVVIEDDGRRISGRHPPGILADFLPRQRAPGAVGCAEVRQVAGIVANAVIPWGPDRHFEILKLAFQAIAAKGHVQRVDTGLRHGNGERHGSLGWLSDRERGAGRKSCQEDEGSTVDHDAPSLGDFLKCCQGCLASSGKP
jgi:hypothetical protein